MHREIVDALKSDRFELSDLGDGTAVLTSLSDSKVITLNKLGTSVLNALLTNETGDSVSALDELAVRSSAEFGIDVARINSDIEGFLIDLSKVVVPPGKNE